MIPMPKEPAIWPHTSRLELTPPLPRARAAAGTAIKPSSADETSRRLLRSAGIVRGMRVIAAGSDGGALAAMAGELVGAGGCVIAVNASSLEAVPRAVLRDVDAPVDALIGRGLLHNSADAAESLRQLIGHVRAGGVVSWHHFADQPEEQPLPAPFDRVEAGAAGTVDALPAALALTRVFFAAGLPLPRLTVSRCDDGNAHTHWLVHAWTHA